MNMIGQRRGDWMSTASGRRFWPLDPDPEDVRIADIAAALSKICRFGGHCRVFYSVAQHSMLVSVVAEDMAPEADKRLAAMWGLCHDAAEAYLGDPIRPLKRHLLNFADIERGVLRVIAAALGLPWPMPPQIARWVKIADEVALATEGRDLCGDPRDWRLTQAPIEPRVAPLDPEAAESLFLARFVEQFGSSR